MTLNKDTPRSVTLNKLSPLLSTAVVCLLAAPPPNGDPEAQKALGGLRVMTPAVRLVSAPLKPLRAVQPDQSVLLGRSAFQAPGDGRGDPGVRTG